MARVFWAALLVFAAWTGACQKPSANKEQHFPEEPPTVMFDIKPVGTESKSGSAQLYDCAYKSGDKTARFRLEWRQNGPLTGEIPMARAGGRFLAVDGSDSSALLTDLKKALEAKGIPKNVPRAKELPFDAVVLADHQSRDATGAMSDSPHGDWLLLKLFLPKGGDDGELFLHLNPVLGKAEFSIKDSDYGDYLLGQFAKVF